MEEGLIPKREPKVHHWAPLEGKRVSRLQTAKVFIQEKAENFSAQSRARKSVAGALCALFAFIACLAGARLISPYLHLPTIVTIPELGDVQGVLQPVARVFRGIPFGTAGRWESPVAAKAWKPETLMADKFRPACMHASGRRKEGVSEDCLYLNVFTPTWGVGNNLNPVLVWFHGGGYSLGAGSDTTPEDVQEFVYTHKVVVVTTNYRLGVFGFAGSESLRTDDGSTGNFGTQDQRLAMHWVKKHIQHFGGDPTQVSVIGWSAGAASISVHLTAPKSRGLFHHGIMMSGGFTRWAALSLEQAESTHNTVAQCVGCDPADKACMLGVDAMKLVACGKSLQYGPVVDGVDLMISPFEAIWKGDPAIDYSVPIIIGNALEDALKDIGRHADHDKLVTVTKDLLKAYPDSVSDALYLYPTSIFHNYATEIFPEDWSPAYWAARIMASDLHFTCIMRNVSKQWQKQGQSVAHWYSWVQPQVFTKAEVEVLKEKSDGNDALPGAGFCYPCPGAGHGSDLAFLFENPSKVDVHGKVVLGDVLTDRLQAYYTNFVWSGNKTDNVGTAAEEAATSELQVSLPIWDEFDPAQMNAMRFLAGYSHQIEHYRQEECDFWDSHNLPP